VALINFPSQIGGGGQQIIFNRDNRDIDNTLHITDSNNILSINAPIRQSSAISSDLYTNLSRYSNDVSNNLNLDKNAQCFILSDFSYNSLEKGYDKIRQKLNIQNNLDINTFTFLSYNNLNSNELILTDENNTIYIRPIPDINGGAYTGITPEPYEITLKIMGNSITQYNLIDIINSQLSTNPLTKGSIIYTTTRNNRAYNVIRLNINKLFTASDYSVVFYDPTSFVKCFIGAPSVRNVSWDSTLGWILGYRKLLSYDLANLSQPSSTILSEPSSTIISPKLISKTTTPPSTNQSTSIFTLISDTTVTTNLFNYVLIEINDYSQSHINDGLITISYQEGNISLPSYANRVVCNTSTQYNGSTSNSFDTTGLTQSQIVSANKIINSRQNKLKDYSTGPFTQDIFAIIPIKPGTAGSTYIEFGGSLQNQDRTYFGPVNLSRFSIKLLDDRGNILDLNNSNWGFSLLCEQLYQNSTI